MAGVHAPQQISSALLLSPYEMIYSALTKSSIFVIYLISTPNIRRNAICLTTRTVISARVLLIFASCRKSYSIHNFSLIYHTVHKSWIGLQMNMVARLITWKRQKCFLQHPSDENTNWIHFFFRALFALFRTYNGIVINRFVSLAKYCAIKKLQPSRPFLCFNYFLGRPLHSIFRLMWRHRDAMYEFWWIFIIFCYKFAIV